MKSPARTRLRFWLAAFTISAFAALAMRAAGTPGWNVPLLLTVALFSVATVATKVSGDDA